PLPVEELAAPAPVVLVGPLVPPPAPLAVVNMCLLLVAEQAPATREAPPSRAAKVIVTSKEPKRRCRRDFMPRIVGGYPGGPQVRRSGQQWKVLRTRCTGESLLQVSHRLCVWARRAP